MLYAMVGRYMCSCMPAFLFLQLQSLPTCDTRCSDGILVVSYVKLCLVCRTAPMSPEIANFSMRMADRGYVSLPSRNRWRVTMLADAAAHLLLHSYFRTDTIG